MDVKKMLSVFFVILSMVVSAGSVSAAPVAAQGSMAPVGGVGVQAPVRSDATAVDVKGQVQWLEAGTTEWKTVGNDQLFSSGDKIKTGAAGEVTLALEDGTVLLVYADTEFVIQSLRKDMNTKRFETLLGVLQGQVRADVEKLQNGSVFEIETPVVVAAVLGTILTPTVGIDGSVGITADEGLVSITREDAGSKLTALLEDGTALFSYNAETGELTITSGGGCFTINGGGKESEVCEGDILIISNGAATFIPGGGDEGEDTPPGDIPEITGGGEDGPTGPTTPEGPTGSGTLS